MEPVECALGARTKSRWAEESEAVEGALLPSPLLPADDAKELPREMRRA